MIHYLTHIGIDFDNTIVDYDSLFYRISLEKSLITPDTIVSKSLVRERIRSLSDGESWWQDLQAEVYGARIHDATLMKNADSFFLECRKHAIRLSIISHKTEFPRQGRPINLRKAALAWLTARGFFDPCGFGFRMEDVHFESSRKDKIDRIASLGCSHFIDDLPEVFEEASFPGIVQRILLSSHPPGERSGNYTHFRCWNEIHHHFFSGKTTD